MCVSIYITLLRELKYLEPHVLPHEFIVRYLLSSFETFAEAVDEFEMKSIEIDLDLIQMS